MSTTTETTLTCNLCHKVFTSERVSFKMENQETAFCDASGWLHDFDAPAPATAQTESTEQQLARFNGKPDHGDECQCAECQRFNAPTPTQGEHTSLPWKTANRFAASKPSNWKQEAKFYQYITTEQSDPVFPARTEAEARMYAAFIVKAVNNHAKLVQCLTNLVKMTEDGDLTTVELDEARAALAEVQDA